MPEPDAADIEFPGTHAGPPRLLNSFTLFGVFCLPYKRAICV